MDLLAAARAEVIARHEFFVNWFTGCCEEAEMAETARAFAPDMQMIPPDGQLITAAQVVAMLQGARGSRGADFAIQIAIITAQQLGPLAVIVYDEHQQSEGRTTRRRSSALFSADEGAPNGVAWRHLHETWT